MSNLFPKLLLIHFLPVSGEMCNMDAHLTTAQTTMRQIIIILSLDNEYLYALYPLLFKHRWINLHFFLLALSYNVSLLEEWLRNRGMQAGGAVASLEPLIQAVQLLQAGKKTEADAKALVQTCTALSSQQVGLLAGLPQLSGGKRRCELWLTSFVSLLSGRLWRFWPSTAPTVTWMKEWRWTSSVMSRYSQSPQGFHQPLVASQGCASRVLCPAGSPQKSLWGSASAAPDGRETSVPCHISLLASPRAPRRAARHTRLPQDLLPAQSLTKPNPLKCIQGLCGAHMLYWLS